MGFVTGVPNAHIPLYFMVRCQWASGCIFSGRTPKKSPPASMPPDKGSLEFTETFLDNFMLISLRQEAYDEKNIALIAKLVP